jgi:threonine aldolase
MISFRFDAPEYSSREIAGFLLEAAAGREIAQDAYCLGGEVGRFESRMAEILGKERAIFMPTGTLANHLALRALVARAARARGFGASRVIVQERSHIHQDSGDTLAALSGLSLVPLGHHRAAFTLEEARSAFADASETRVRTGIGALCIESPVRRCHGETFDFGEMRKIALWAREEGIGSHLDGARLFIASHYTGVGVPDYASLFDTVYVSLYKYFGTPSGAVLAGPASLIDGMYHERRMFGGSLNQAWIFASLALEALPRFDEEFSRAVSVSEALIGTLAGSGIIEVERIPRGSNIFALRLAIPAGGMAVGTAAGTAGEMAAGNGGGPSGVAADAGYHARFADGLRRRGILVPEAAEGTYYLKVNTSILGSPPDGIAAAFLAAAREAREA